LPDLAPNGSAQENKSYQENAYDGTDQEFSSSFEQEDGAIHGWRECL
jgi:hypothetical protein